MAQEASFCLPETERVATMEKIRNLIRDGTYGLDYAVIPRGKNQQLRLDYNIDDTKIQEILLQLDIEDLYAVKESNHELHPQDIVFIFKKKCLLMPRWREGADFEEVVLYIKITWPVENEGSFMLIISFHEDNI